MYASLVDRGVEARLCLFHGENHELSRSGKPKHRLRRLQEITDWFEKHARMLRQNMVYEYTCHKLGSAKDMIIGPYCQRKRDLRYIFCHYL